MKVEYDRDTCIGMFQCVAEWDAFERDEDAGKAVLVGSEPAAEDGEDEGEGESEGDGDAGDVYVREVPEGSELDAKFAARACPVDAIRIVDEDGEQLVP